MNPLIQVYRQYADLTYLQIIENREHVLLPVSITNWLIFICACVYTVSLGKNAYTLYIVYSWNVVITDHADIISQF